MRITTNQVTNNPMVSGRFLEGLPQRFTVHHHITEDGPAPRFDELAHVQAQVRIIDIFRRFVLYEQVGFERDVCIR